MRAHEKPRVAIIGGGIAGLAAARALRGRARVLLFERAPRLGGHAHTISVPSPGGELALDCGFLVFNRARYPLFSRMLDELGVQTRTSDMAFGVWSDDGRVAYSTSTARSMFARPGSLWSKRHHRLVAAILGFLWKARADLGAGRAAGLTIGDYLQDAPPELGDLFVKPLATALWSIDTAAVNAFPAEVLLRFLHVHGMLRPLVAPRWRTIAGGSRRYVDAVAASLDAEVCCNTGVARVYRDRDAAVIALENGQSLAVDRVVVAVHADQALALLDQPGPAERAALSAIRYSDNRVVVHTDSSRLPRQRAARASWSYRLCRDGAVEVSYWLNRLQKLGGATDYLVTLDPKTPIAGSAVLHETRMSHPLFDLAALEARRTLARCQGQRSTYYAGAYFGFGFHEDGFRSGLAAAAQLCADWASDRSLGAEAAA